MHRIGFMFCLLTAGAPLHVAAQWQGQAADKLIATEKAEHAAAQAWARRTGFPDYPFSSAGAHTGIIRLEHGHPVFFTTHNKLAGTQTNTINLHNDVDLGFLLTGDNLAVGLWDEGVVFDSHQELQLRVEINDPGGPSNHSTHVAGTLAASGIRDEALGMAPDARLISYNWNYHTSEMRIEAENGMLLSNHSYGRIAGWQQLSVNPGEKDWYWFGDPAVSESEDYTFGYYDRDAFLFDHIAYTYPTYLPVVSAGNERDDAGPESGSYKALDTAGRWLDYDIATRPIMADGGSDGFDTLTSIAVAKNVLTVGSVGYRTFENRLKLSPYSSAGPTDDGRIKPDLVGVGEDLLSPVASGVGDYAMYSGTSMATPNITGSLALLQQLALQKRAQALPAATLKGLVIHTATDLGTPGPDFMYGWGLLNTTRAAQVLDDALTYSGSMLETQIANGETLTEQLHNPGRGPVRVTLSWTDAPAQVDINGSSKLNNRSPLLVNDLDAKLIHNASGAAYYPYTLSTDNPASPAQQGDNNRDPVEQIYIARAAPGDYTLQVSHKRTLTNDIQAFSIILSGIHSTRKVVELDSAWTRAEIGSVAIEWRTLFESVEGHFVIDRTALNTADISAPQRLSFNRVSEVPAAGPSTPGSAYSFFDEVFLTGTYKYRILFIDEENDTRTLVAELVTEIPAPENFSIQSIYPNPTTGPARVVVDVPATMQLTAFIHDLLGRSIRRMPPHAFDAGRNFITIDTDDLVPGIYFVELRSADVRLLRKMVVMR